MEQFKRNNEIDVGDLSSGPAVIEGRTADRATRGLNFLSAETSLGAPASSKSSIFLRRIVGEVFMRMNSKCAHQVRPPLRPIWRVIATYRKFRASASAMEGSAV